MYTLACVALVAGQLCFAGDKITCSDVQIQGVESCKAQFSRLGVATSNSTTTTIIITKPHDPHVGGDVQ